MLKVALCYFVMFGLMCAANANEDMKTDLPRVFLIDPASLKDVKERINSGDEALMPALKKLRSDADGQLDAGPFSVTFKEITPPSGDKHDYMSMGPYWWPDPDKPDGLPYIRRDGEVNPERNQLDSVPMSRMMSAVNTLSLAYYLTDHRPYGEHAAKLIRIWFLDEETRMNPHLEYGQAIPGRTEGRGIGIIDTKGLANLVDSVGMLAGLDAWTDEDQSGLEEWFRDYVNWLTESSHGKYEEAYPNNHGTWYDVQTSAMALFAGQDHVAERLLKLSAERRIATQIEPDGSQPLELARTRSLNYSIMNLLGMFDIAHLAERFGLDLWNYETEDGRSIRKALDWLTVFAAGEKEWEHEQIISVSDQSWVPLLRRAAIKFDEPKYESLLEKLDADVKTSRINLLNPSMR